ncbi:MAG TPA: SDR family NAD(P)-dependent oxidoreductase [Limnochordia bacterium]|nr:SDR family NAD(P)-dependent oxidoreductase [Limnochordia bacterium]
MPPLGGKVALVTGASSGIGRAIAVELLRRGAHVGLVARRAERLDAIGRAAASFPGRALSLPGDVGEPATLPSAVARTVAAFGRLDLLINNAGVGHFGGVATSAPGEAERIFRINAVAPVWAIQAALPELKRRRGLVVNISSPVGRLRLGGMGLYAAAKAALDTYSEVLRHELEADGVDVMLVYPGLTRTEFFDAALGTVPGSKLRRFLAGGEEPDALAVRVVNGIEQRRQVVWGRTGARWAVWLAAHSRRLRRLIARRL